MTVVAVVGADDAGALLATLTSLLRREPDAQHIQLIEATSAADEGSLKKAGFALLLAVGASEQAQTRDRRWRETLQRHAVPYAVIHGEAPQQRAEAAIAALRPLFLNRANDHDQGKRWRPRCLECLDPACEQALHRRLSE